MGLRDIADIDGDDISDFFWKWRCKIVPRKEPKFTEPIDLDSLEDDDEKEIEGPPKNPGFGADATVKMLYEGRCSSAGYYEWVDYPPKQISQSAAIAQDRVAIKVYKIKDQDKLCIGGRWPLKYYRIEIQNFQLIHAIRPIFKDKENHLLETEDITQFDEPFQSLWFCQEEIKELYKRTDAEDALKNYTGLLIRVMDDVFSELRARRRRMLASGLIDFKTAWILFGRGTTVYSYGLNSEYLCKVESRYYDPQGNHRTLIVLTKVLTFNGEAFVWQDRGLYIPYFEGSMPICELDHYPLEFHPEKEAIKKRCIARGRKMLDFQGLRYCCYNGLALHSENAEASKHNVEGRVLIDVFGYNKYHLHQGSRENNDPDTQRNQAGGEQDSNKQIEDAADGAKKPGVKSAIKKRLTEKAQQRNKEDMLSREDDLGFMSELVGGYALKNKIWVKFYLEDIEPMLWNETAYDHLVYDAQQKDLVLSFVENHNTNPEVSENDETMGDVIQGKGQGLIVLLSGPPGTGKTLMAEAVADRTKRPLFYLQAEDLGISAAVLGAKLKRVFEMATDWDAVILLDEADVFMAERSPSDIYRNELVSIFLREVEYFRGIIFLTTNLYHTIDSAFRSRVNLHLLFQSLGRDAREMVWRKFLQRMPRQRLLTGGGGGKEKMKTDDDECDAEVKALDDEDIKEISLWQLNGREIKNAVKMVRSWCDHKGYVMTLGRLENGIKATTPHARKDDEVDGDLYH